MLAIPHFIIDICLGYESLRFVDPASGRIVIDGIDISKIGLHDLRSRIVRCLAMVK